jgi:hypothetical protein
VSPGDWWDLRVTNELDEVRNLMEVGEALVVSPRQGRRHPEERGTSELSDERSEPLGKKFVRGGRKPNGRVGWPRRGEGQESIGHAAG